MKARRIEGTKLPPLFKVLHDSTREIINEGQHSRDRFVDDFFFAVHESGLLRARFSVARYLCPFFGPFYPGDDARKIRRDYCGQFGTLNADIT